MARSLLLVAAVLLLAASVASALRLSASPLQRLSQSHGRPFGAPAAYSFDLVTYDVADTSCAKAPTGGMSFGADTCTATTGTISTWFHSLTLSNANLTDHSYSLSLYFESPLCDDFVGWFTNGTLSSAAGAGVQGTSCFQVENYLNFAVKLSSSTSPNPGKGRGQDGMLQHASVRRLPKRGN